jgi:hypothetical protein
MQSLRHIDLRDAPKSALVVKADVAEQVKPGNRVRNSRILEGSVAEMPKFGMRSMICQEKM